MKPAREMPSAIISNLFSWRSPLNQRTLKGAGPYFLNLDEYKLAIRLLKILLTSFFRMVFILTIQKEQNKVNKLKKQSNDIYGPLQNLCKTQR